MQTNNFGDMQKIEGIHHIELYVSNAKHSSYFYCRALGFRVIAYGDQSTGLKDRLSYVLQQGDCYIILTSPLQAESKIRDYLDTHGDGVKDVCFIVENANDLRHKLKERRVKFVPTSCMSYFAECDASIFSIKAFGDVTNSFITNKRLSQDHFAPLQDCFRYINTDKQDEEMISHIDHIALCGPLGFIDKISNFYCKTLDFVVSRMENVKSKDSGMRTVVLESTNSVIKIPVVEPLKASVESALEKFLIYNAGAGVHHVAFYTNDIVDMVDKTSRRGAEYMKNDAEYYDLLQKKKRSCTAVDLKTIKDRSILYDVDEQGYLLQIFSQPTQPQPTFFYELIERKNNQGFGSGNIKALYDSIDNDYIRD